MKRISMIKTNKYNGLARISLLGLELIFFVIGFSLNMVSVFLEIKDIEKIPVNSIYEKLKRKEKSIYNKLISREIGKQNKFNELNSGYLNIYIIMSLKELYVKYNNMKEIVVLPEIITIDELLEVKIDFGKIKDDLDLKVLEEYFINGFGRFVESLNIKNAINCEDILQRILANSLFLLKKLNISNNENLNLNCFKGIIGRKRKINELYLSSCRLTSIPEFVSEINETLEVIDLSANVFTDTEIDDFFLITYPKVYKKLKHIKLSGCHLNQIPMFIWTISNQLVSLDLSFNRNINLEGIWLSFDNLKKLILCDCNLRYVPIGLFLNCRKLEELDISYNDAIDLEGLTDLWGNLKELKELKIKRCYLENVPTLINFFKDSLEVLSLDYNNICFESTNWSMMKKLRILELRGCNLKEIPNCVWQLSNCLEELTLTDNMNIGLDGQWDKMVKLNTLILFQCDYNKLNFPSYLNTYIKDIFFE